MKKMMMTKKMMMKTAIVLMNQITPKAKRKASMIHKVTNYMKEIKTI